MEKDFYIKNMVCNRCIKVVKEELESVNINAKNVSLGKITVDITKGDSTIFLLRELLLKNGFLLIENPEEQLVESVKINLIQLLQKLPLEMKVKLSEYLSNQLHQDYFKVSKLFSYTEKTTIEKYFIKLKIEKVKELIQLDQFNFTESQQLDYSNVNHLSSQFKNETGMSLTTYKSMNEGFRNSLDQIL
jgi:AraC-like DNA-binding protein/copper chaperone CopZ